MAAPSSQNLVALLPMPNGHPVPLNSFAAVGQEGEIWIRVKKLFHALYVSSRSEGHRGLSLYAGTGLEDPRDLVWAKEQYKG